MPFNENTRPCLAPPTSTCDTDGERPRRLNPIDPTNYELICVESLRVRRPPWPPRAHGEYLPSDGGQAVFRTAGRLSACRNAFAPRVLLLGLRQRASVAINGDNVYIESAFYLAICGVVRGSLHLGTGGGTCVKCACGTAIHFVFAKTRREANVVSNVFRMMMTR